MSYTLFILVGVASQLDLFGSFEEFTEAREINYALKWSTNESVAEIEGLFEQGKSLLIIGAGCHNDNYSQDQVGETAFSLNHAK
jgi:hypothetical protein